MPKFFTYEERRSLQKYLKESLSFKESARRMDKNPPIISREVLKYSSQIATGIPVFPSMSAKAEFIAGRKRSVEMSVLVNRIVTVNFASPVTPNCTDLLEEICMARFHVPYVYNGCEPLGNADCFFKSGKSFHTIE